MKKFKQVYKGFIIQWSNRHRLYFIKTLKNIPLSQTPKLSDAKKFIDEQTN